MKVCTNDYCYQRLWLISHCCRTKRRYSYGYINLDFSHLHLTKPAPINSAKVPDSQYLPRFNDAFPKLQPRGVWQYEETISIIWEISFTAPGRGTQELLILCGFWTMRVPGRDFCLQKHREPNLELVC